MPAVIYTPICLSLLFKNPKTCPRNNLICPNNSDLKFVENFNKLVLVNLEIIVDFSTNILPNPLKPLPKVTKLCPWFLPSIQNSKNQITLSAKNLFLKAHVDKETVHCPIYLPSKTTYNYSNVRPRKLKTPLFAFKD